MCAIRESREGCGGLRVPRDAVSPCTVHPRRPRRGRGMPPDADCSASGHGPCHRPACPLSHGGQAQARQARVFHARLSAGASVGSRPVESVLSTTPTGGTPNHLQFSALSYRRNDPGQHKHVVRVGSGRIHARPEGRDSLLESGSRPSGRGTRPARISRLTRRMCLQPPSGWCSVQSGHVQPRSTTSTRYSPPLCVATAYRPMPTRAMSMSSVRARIDRPSRLSGGARCVGVLRAPRSVGGFRSVMR